MKRTILSFTLTIFTLLFINAQNEFTGDGDGYSWDDPMNWISGEVPQDGDDIIIEGFSVDFYGSPYTYSSLELISGSNLLIQGEMVLYGDLTVDPTSVLSFDITDLNDFSKIILGGNYYFNGETDIIFSGYVPQIGNSYLLIQGLLGSCGIPSTDIVPESQSGGGYQTFIGVQCQSNGILFTVTDINYTTAKSWDGEGGDNMWSTAANWDPNGVPTSSDVAIINLPSGSTVNTNGAGTTLASQILVGDFNTLVVNGDLTMYSTIGVNATGSLNWKAGSLSRSNTGVQSFILNRGFLLIDGPGNKTMENGFEIISQGSDASVVVAEKGFDINDGEVNIYTGDIIIDGDNITIGYTSGSQHSLRLFNTSSLVKTSGSGTSSINLTNFNVFSSASVVSLEGTLAFGEDLSNNGKLSGGGNFQLPNSHVEQGNISPGGIIAMSRGNSSRNDQEAGTLTFVGNLTTGATSDLRVNIDGTTAGDSYDQIIVTNQAVLEGNITPILNYLPANDDSFEILKAANLSSCNYPAQVVGNFNGTDFTFDVVCQNNTLYLNGPGVVLSTQDEMIDAFSVFPNPTKNELFIQSKELNDGGWKLFNQLGQMVKSGNLQEEQTKISLHSIESGLYFIEIQNANNVKITRKVVVSR